MKIELNEETQAALKKELARRSQPEVVTNYEEYTLSDTDREEYITYILQMGQVIPSPKKKGEYVRRPLNAKEVQETFVWLTDGNILALNGMGM